ncbi:cobaltochelatase subunit CobN [Methanohalophilus sp.]
MGSDYNSQAIEEVISNGNPGLNLETLNATQANSTDFDNKKVVFLASLDNGTLNNINTTLNQSSHIISYDISEMYDPSNYDDSNITELWENGGYHNVKTLARYMNDTFYGEGLKDSEKLEVAFVFSRESAVITMENIADDPSISQKMNITTYFGRSDENLDFNFSGKDIIMMRDLAAPVIETILPDVNNARDNGTDVICVGDLIQSYEMHNVNLSEIDYADINNYLQYDSEENFKRLSTFLGVKFAGNYDIVLEAEERPIYGIYHPDAPLIYTNTSDFLDWYSLNGYDSEKPTVGIVLSYLKYVDSRDAPLVEALVDSFESRGCNVIVTSYSYKDSESVNHLMLNGEPIVDSAIIISRGSRLNYKDSEQGIADLKTWNVTPLNGIRLFYSVSAEEWDNSSHGVGPEQSWQLAASEMDGIIEPIVIGCKDPELGDGAYYPIDYQVEWLSNRTVSWMNLHRKENSEKKIVIPYYAAEAGKAGVGADIDYYLDAQASLANLLKGMDERGYNLGNKSLPDRDELSEIMMERGHNTGTWAPGALEDIVENGNAILIPESDYMEWFNALPADKQSEMEDIWGPAPGEIMVYENESGKYLVIPKIEYGNVLLAPNPMSGWNQNDSVTYHDGSVPPTHQTLAFYKYVADNYEADALFSIYSTIMTMPGKESGLSAKDWGAIIMQDLPHIHVLPMDAEGIFDHRRANMLIVDFLTPTIVPSGLYGNYSLLQQDITMFKQVTDESVKEQYRQNIINKTLQLNLDNDLGVNLESINDNSTKVDSFISDLDNYLDELKTTFMPYGSHTLSEPPEGQSFVAMVEGMLGSDFKEHVASVNSTPGLTTELLNETVLNNTDPEEAQTIVLGTIADNVTSYLNLSIEYRDNINASTKEIPRILDALEGKYIPPGPAGDPVRNPEALPTGRNLCTFDDRLIPTDAAWNVGCELGDELLANHLEENGTYPNKVSFLLWSIETTRHHGTMESEIFYMLGVEPIWDSKGRVKDVRRIDSDKLGRPRIDVVVTTSGSYRDMYASRLQLIDKAVKKAANAPDNETYPNYVKQNSEAIKSELIEAGYDPEIAEELAVSRIFCPPPGSYTPGIEHAISGGTWENSEAVSDLYISRMGHVYGENIWGEQYEDVFRQNLADVELGVFSRSSNVYGTLEHPMVASYFGGLSMAVESVSGKRPQMYINNQRTPGNEGVETLQRFMSRDLRSRYLNPSWIEGMMQDGYDGTRYMNAFVENMRIWDSVDSELVTEDMWNDVYKTYFTEQSTGIQEHLKATNPYAYQSMAMNLLESARRGEWTPSEEVLEELAKKYEESVVENGPTCCHHTCGNPTLNGYVEGIVSVPGFHEALEKVTSTSDTLDSKSSSSSSGGSSVGSARIIQSSESTSNQTTAVEQTQSGYGESVNKPSSDNSESSPQNEEDYVEGYEMTKEKPKEKDSAGSSFSGADIVGTLLILAAVGAMYIGFRRRGM